MGGFRIRIWIAIPNSNINIFVEGKDISENAEIEEDLGLAGTDLFKVRPKYSSKTFSVLMS